MKYFEQVYWFGIAYSKESDTTEWLNWTDTCNLQICNCVFLWKISHEQYNSLAYKIEVFITSSLSNVCSNSYAPLRGITCSGPEHAIQWEEKPGRTEPGCLQTSPCSACTSWLLGPLKLLIKSFIVSTVTELCEFVLTVLSGRFISLPQFLSPQNKYLEQQTKGFKTTDKSQLSSAQADRSFIRQTLPRCGSQLIPKESS